TPRQHNMYSIDLNSIVPHKDLTCLVAKASADECILWHRRLGHLNVKTMKKLVRHNLVRGLPTKSFDNDHTCTACLKGKQHNASCKSKLVNSVTKPLHTLHMDLFGSTSNPAIGFLKPFGCHVMILNTLDNLGKFEAKRDEGTNSTNLSGTKDAANQEVKKDVSSLRYVVLPNWAHDALLESSSMESPIPTVSSPVPTACLNDSPEPSSEARLISKRVANQEETPSLDNILSLTNRFENILGVTTSSDKAIGVEADVSNMETTISASPTPTLRIHKDHPKSQIIGHVDTSIQTRHKSKDMEEQSFIATIHQKTDPVLLQFCLFSCFLSQVEPKK
nr:ribonuclease H-like domain-containing protein [Tanacetum cinerariifolium]